MILGVLGVVVLNQPPKTMGIWTCGGGCDKGTLKSLNVILKVIVKKPPLKVMIIWTFKGGGYITFENPTTYPMHRKYLTCD